MPSITTKDGTGIFYKDWGSGKPLVFSHGWPLDADAWDAQMLVLKSDANPEGLPLKVFDDIREGVTNRAQFYRDLAVPFYGYNRPNAKLSQGVIESFWLQGMLGGVKAQYDCVKAFSETDFTNDLREIDIPVLLLHGDDDQIVPIDDAARKSVKLLKKATLKVIAGGPHGMATTLADQINKELLAFVKD